MLHPELYTLYSNITEINCIKLKSVNDSMVLKYIEIIILVIISLVFLGLFVFRNSIKWKNNNGYRIVMVITALSSLFIGIHFFFCYQIGFPASVTQNNTTDLSLSSSDWLSFLSGYLGFSGSLVMAYLVYRQSETINSFVLSEYKPYVSLVVQKCVKSTEYKKKQEEFSLTDIVQHIPGMKTDEYYCYHCAAIIEENNIYENFNVLIFAEIVNNSKIPINNLSFKSIEIKGIQSEHVLTYVKRGGNYDLADGYIDILPGRSLKRCFLIENVPKVLDISWMTFYFSSDTKILFNPKFLVSKTESNSLLLINTCDQLAQNN